MIFILTTLVYSAELLTDFRYTNVDRIRVHLNIIFVTRAFWNLEPRKISGKGPSTQNLVDVGKRANFGVGVILRLASRLHRRTDNDQWGLKTPVSAQRSAFAGLNGNKKSELMLMRRATASV